MATQSEDRPDGNNDSNVHRRSIAVMMLAGILLVILGQMVYPYNYGRWRWLVYLEILTGLLFFTLAGFTAAGTHWPGWLDTLLRRISNWLSISTARLLLLFIAPLFALLAYLAAGDGVEAHQPTISLAAWFIAILAVLLGSYSPGSKETKVFDGRDWLIIVGLLIVAAALRVIGLNDLPGTLSGDEGSAGLFAQKFLDGEINNIFGPGWFSFPALYFAIQSQAIAILGRTAEALRISSALAGSATVTALYWLARIYFDRSTAIIAALFLAVFHYHIHFSRIGLNNIWDGFFATIALGGLAYGWKSSSRKGFQIAGLALGLGQYFYVSLRIFPLLILIWTLFALVFDRQTLKKRIPDLMVMAFIAFTVSLPNHLYYLNHPDEYYAPLQRVTIFDGWLDEEVLLREEPAALIIVKGMGDSALGITNLPIRHWYNPGSPLLLAGAAGLFLLGFIWLLSRLKIWTALLILPLLAIVFFGGLTVGAPASQRYIIVAPVVALLVALPLAESAGWLAQSWPRLRNVILAALIAAVALLALTDLRYYFLEVYDNYTLGGTNTEIATEVAHYLLEDGSTPHVYFLGFPRMSFYSHSTIPYLVPGISATDVIDPLRAEATFPLLPHMLFIVLPERSSELEYIRSAHPQGRLRHFENDRGQQLFFAYEVDQQ